MDGQHSYEISLKKDGLFINLSSDDVYFISKQMDKWFRILLDDSYVPVSLPQRFQPSAPVEAPALPQTPSMVAPVTEQSVAPEQPAPAPAPPEPVVSLPMQPQPEVVLPPAPAPVVPEPQPVPVAQPVEPPAPPAPAQPAVPPPAIQPIVDLPPVMQSQSQLQPQPQPVEPQLSQPEPAPPVAPPAPQPVAAMADVLPMPAQKPQAAPPASKDDFETVMDTVMRDLEKPVTPVTERQPALVPQPAVELPPREPVDLSLVTSLSDLCEQAHAGTSEDYLLLASYYLNQMEYQETFPLKRINSNLVKSGLTPVNHSVLEAVLSKGLLAMVPDMTGTAEVSEYRITPEGVNAINNLF